MFSLRLVLVSLIAAAFFTTQTAFAEDSAPRVKTMIPMVSSGLPVAVEKVQFRSCANGLFSRVDVGPFTYFANNCDGDPTFSAQIDPEILLHVLTYQDTKIFVRILNEATEKQVELQLGEISPLVVSFNSDNKLQLAQDQTFFEVGDAPIMIGSWAVSRLAGQEAFLFQRAEIALWVGNQWDRSLWIEAQGTTTSYTGGLWKELLDIGTHQVVDVQKYVYQ